MRTQFRSAEAARLSLAWGEALTIQGVAGEMTVLGGRVWVTRESALGDHIVEAGQRFRVEAGDVAVLEPWVRGEAASLAWAPGAQCSPVEALLRRAAALALRGVAVAARFFAAGLEFLARKAASMARRAQGCMRTGDSMASAGTVQ